MRFLFRLTFYAVVILLLLTVAGVFLVDIAAKSAAVSQIRLATDMDVKIGKLSVGLLTPTVNVENVTLYNTAEFGGSPFLEIPELYLEYDRVAARRGKIHFKLVRLNVAELDISRDKKGRFNYEPLLKAVKPTGSNPPPPVSRFTGIDTLNLTLKDLRVGTNQMVYLGIDHQVFLNINNEKDFKALLFVLAARSGGRLSEAFPDLISVKN